MIHQRKLSVTLVVFAFFGLCGSLRTLGQTTRFVPVQNLVAEGGTLTNRSSESRSFSKASPAGTRRLQMKVAGTCDPRPPKPNMRISELTKNLNVDLPTFGVVVHPLDKDLVLHKFWLEIYSGRRLVFRTLPDCTGCSKSYKGLPSAGSTATGYVFTLDEKAISLARRFFVPENRITLKVSGHNGVVTTFHVVRAEP
jgi:hypothetical protein